MYTLNKFAWSVANPFTLGFVMLGLSLVLSKRKWMFAAVAWIWIWSTPLLTWTIGIPLQAGYNLIEIGDVPNADAIVDMGGGVGEGVNGIPKLYEAADRAYYSAKLWHAGKAPIVIPSCEHAAESDGRFINDLGVPESAIRVEDKARNTEENALFVKHMLEFVVTNSVYMKPKVLLVTSISHMRRSMLMFEKYAPELEMIPVPSDSGVQGLDEAGFNLNWLIPSASSISSNLILAHEWLGFWWYCYFR